MRETKRKRDEETKCADADHFVSPSLRLSVSTSRLRAFTLTELLVVIGLIVLLIAIAVPTLDFLTGSRSIDGTQNQISAYLARARSEAIGLQEVRGVFFYLENRTDRATMAMVRAVDRPQTLVMNIPPDTGPEVFLDLVPETETITLPRGVGVQVVDDTIYGTGSPRPRLDDAYIGYNRQNMGFGPGPSTLHDTRTAYGGVILFDGSGKLISRRYAFATTTRTVDQPTRMGDLLYRPAGDLQARPEDYYLSVQAVVPRCSDTTPDDFSPKSSMGLALFDLEAYRSSNPGVDDEPVDRDVQFNLTQSYAGSNEAKEEDWLDQNALLLLVNRYNGTLVRAE